MTTIKLKRGLKANLPSSAPEGEPLVTLDTGEFYLGNGNNKPLIPVIGNANYKQVEHSTNAILLANNDWSGLVYQTQNNGSCAYSEADKGIVISGELWLHIKVRMPVDPQAKYICKVRVKKKSGNGTFYIGAKSLDNNYTNLATDTANSFNYFTASAKTIAIGVTTTYVGVIGGYNATNENNPNKFDPEAKYFDLVVVANYQSNVTPSETVIESIELTKVSGLMDFGKEVNVLDFGADSTGVNNSTQALRNALDYAKNNNIRKVIAPAGSYLLDAYVTWRDNDKILTIFNGITLEGDGYFTEFKVNPSSINADGSHRLFFIESFAIANNFRINGQKDLINRTGLTATDFVGILAKEYQTDYSYQNVWVHDVIGINKESFGVMSYRGSERVKYKNIIGWNVEGTPIHVTGDFLIDKMATDIDVINCATYNNTWQGISLYGAKNVRIYNHHAYDNDGNGLNFEFTYDVDVYNSKSYNNGRAGYGSYGKANFRLHNCTSKDNNTTNQNWIGEIALSPGAWWTGDAWTRSTAGIVEINNCHIEPTPGNRHLHYQSYSLAQTGTPTPDGIIINNSGVENWKIGVTKYDGSTSETTILPNVYYKGFNVSQPLLLEKLSNFTFTSNLTSAAYSGAGNINPNALTLTGITSQYGNAYSKYILKPNRTYHVIVRYKAESTDKWLLMSRDLSQSDPVYSICLTGDSSFIGQWKIAEGLFKTFNNEQRIQIQYDGTVFPDNMHIDYIVVKEILDNPNTSALYDFMQIGANKIIQSSSMPTTGTWTKGDICYNTSPAPTGTAGSKYIIHGWQRITDGSNNVLNTDWVEMRYLTGQ